MSAQQICAPPASQVGELTAAMRRRTWRGFAVRMVVAVLAGTVVGTIVNGVVTFWWVLGEQARSVSLATGIVVALIVAFVFGLGSSIWYSALAAMVFAPIVALSPLRGFANFLLWSLAGGIGSFFYQSWAHNFQPARTGPGDMFHLWSHVFSVSLSAGLAGWYVRR